MTNQFEWLHRLPREALVRCVADLVETAHSPRYDATFAAWQSTAEAYADPELLKALTTPTGGDFGEAAPPCLCLCHPLEDEHIIATCVCCRKPSTKTPKIP